MSFKEYDFHPSFFDLEVKQSFGNSRTQQFLSEVQGAINWKPVSEILTVSYPVGKSEVGNKAYPPLMLMKALLLQKWFSIKSDPELENQINDRLSFKAFIGLPFSDPSPDHSILCRFRERIGKKGLNKIFQELLLQFKNLGFSIESGLAVDARIIRSASRPISGNKLDELREKRKQSKKKTRFQRDLDSDWTAKNKKAFFGMKEHASVDVGSGLVLCATVSKASVHDTNYFSFVVANSLHGENLDAFADKAYCNKSNREFLQMNGVGDGIMRKNQINAKLTEKEIDRNKEISKLRYKIEQYFGITAKYHGAGKARFTSLLKEGWDHLCGAMAFNIKRVVLGIRKQEATATA